MPPRTKFTDTDQYLSIFPKDVKAILEKIRETIKKKAPDSTEKISYGIPSFRYKETYLIYFAGYAKHVGIYPITTAMKSELGKEIAPYEAGKGTLRFPLNKSIPYSLIGKIVTVRLKEIQSQKKS